MNTPATVLRPLTGVDMIDALTNGTYWVLDTDRTLTWAIADFNVFTWANPSARAADIAQAYAAFSQFIPVAFSYQGAYADPRLAPADLVTSLDGSNLFFDSPQTWAEGFFPNAALDRLLLPAAARDLYPSAAGDIWINLYSDLSSQTSFQPGTIGFAAFLHEIGHTLGLKHPHDDGGTGHPTFSSLGAGAVDADWFTIMSYNDSYPLSATYWHPATPMIGDVLALQSIYGANLSAHAGADRYEIGNNNMFQTLFDPLGANTLDFRISGHSWTIDLGAVLPASGHPYEIGLAVPSDEGVGVPSSLYWLYGNFATVYASNQNDTIACAPGGTAVMLGTGSATVTGGSGWDTCALAGSVAGYTIAPTGQAYVIRNTASGATDTVSAVERIYFHDAAIAFDGAGSAGQAYRIYQAAFDRAPDLDGLGYWIGAMDAGLALHDVAAGFIDSPEFRALYGADPTAGGIAAAFYQNVLHRAPDAAGLAYWTGVLEARPDAAADVLIGFSESQENQASLLGATAAGILYHPYFQT